jgi:hypothetical protein
LIPTVSFLFLTGLFSLAVFMLQPVDAASRAELINMADVTTKPNVPDCETIEQAEGGRGAISHGGLHTGTVQLLDDNTVVLIPTPSPDPKGKAPNVNRPRLLQIY